MLFEWDPRKAAANRVKHRVSFDEAVTAFADPMQVTEFDSKHSREEDRFVLLGRTRAGRLVVVVHTLRASTVRLISARLARHRERRIHEGP